MLASASILTAVLILGIPTEDTHAQGCQANRFADSATKSNVEDKFQEKAKTSDAFKGAGTDKLILFDDNHGHDLRHLSPYIFNPCCPEITSCCPKR